ncbi:hypothetical protein HPB48_008226 [Haemaphysalis longicornis]|uniref:Uncharacterized protein n=1 Tax=Haemaphysalis longicornis TaxID=44386 RepID=A0A9J6H2S4_HAELO|nr:hypothetical protein HPB48_008226 [Haemaphysalis longicornis]
MLPMVSPSPICGSESSTPTWGPTQTSAGTLSFVADEDADTAEPCTDEGSVNEVRGKSDAEESDTDDDDTSEPAPISAPIAMGYI